MADLICVEVNIREHPKRHRKSKWIVQSQSRPSLLSWSGLSTYFSSTFSGPAPLPVLFDPTQFRSTIGDMHGNAMKLLYFLLHQDAATLREEDYDEFVDIYETDITKLNKADSLKLMERFHQVLNKVHIVPGAKIRLLGDELSDRGMNDYYTLKIIQKMITDGSDVEIIMSNHSLEFLLQYERAQLKNEKLEDQKEILLNVKDEKDPLAQSLHTLRHCLKEGKVNPQEMDEAYALYLSKIKFISYDFDQDHNLNFYAHSGAWDAPSECLKEMVMTLRNNGFSKKTLPDLTKNMTQQEIIQMIDEINESIKNAIAEKKLATLLDCSPDPLKPLNNVSLNPFVKILWNRPKETGQYSKSETGVHQYCGHDSHVGTNTKSLNNSLGQSLRSVVGEMEFLISNETQNTAEYIPPAAPRQHPQFVI